MKKIRVLHVLKNLDFGGAEAYVFKLIRDFDVVRYKIFLAHTRGGPLLEQFEALPVNTFMMSDRRLNSRSPLSNMKAMYHLYRFVRCNRIGLIHTHTTHADGGGR